MNEIAEAPAPAPAPKVKNSWDKRIARAEKFSENAVQHGQRVYARYEDKRDDVAAAVKRVNLFYANVNTIKESLFNSLPKPEVSRLHKGDYEDDAARVAALVLQRALSYEVQCAEHFEHAIKSAILDRLVPGIGQVWVRFDENDDSGEAIFIDTVFWEDFIYEPARSWEQVGWCGRRLELTKAEVTQRWGADGLTQLQQPKNNSNTTPKEINDNKYVVYEIWNKRSKKVMHVAKGAEFLLDERDDPYQLPGFFPCPKPLIANPTTAAFLPVTDYHLSQDQYNQLDVLYARIGLIINAVKVAGCYDSSETQTIGRMLDGAENKLIPVDNWAMYAEKGGSKGMIDWYPVEQVVSVLQTLESQFEMIKSLLAEISGMADIVRGDSNQYETASAQQIKAQFASVRMNGYQRDTAEFVRDVLRIMAGLVCNLYSDSKIMSIVGTISQADQQFLPQAAEILRNSISRMYKVDIEADSLTQSDWALEKSQRMEVVGYIGQLLGQMIPAVEQTPELGPLMMVLMKFSVAGFKGAAEIEGMLDQQMEALAAKAKNPAPKPPSPEEQKMQLEQQKMQMEMQLKQQEATQQAVLAQQESDKQMQVEQAQMQADLMVKNAELEHKKQMAALDMQIKMLELKVKQQEAEMKLRFQAVSGQQKIQQAEAQAEIKREEKENGESEND